MAAESNSPVVLEDYEEDEVPVRIFVAIDSPNMRGGPVGMTNYLAASELAILKKIVNSMKICGKHKNKEKKNSEKCSRCGKRCKKVAGTKA